MAVSLTTSQVIYAAQTKLLALADVIEASSSFKRVKDEIRIGEALIRYIRALQTDSTLTVDEQLAICQHMITIGDLYDFPASPTITSNEIFSYSAGAQVGPQGAQGVPGKDGGGTDYNQFGLTVTTDVDSFNITDADGAEWSYKVKSGSNMRAGRITAVWLLDGTQVKFAEYSTMDIGSTTGVNLSVVYVAGTIKLRATITSGTWDINGTRYFIPNKGAGVIVQSTVLQTGKILVGNSSNIAEAVTMSGDVTINSAGVAAISAGVIDNADIKSSASINYSKLAPLAPNKALVTSSGGIIITAPNVTDTELNFLDGVTSNIQTQLDSKIGSVTGAISTVVSADLTPSRAVISNSSGKIAAHATATETSLGYIATLSSAAQAQIDSKLNLTGGTLTGTLTTREISVGTNYNITLFGTGGVFADTGDITTNGRGVFSGGLRTGLTEPYLKIKVLSIGDWNMDLDASKAVAHGITSAVTKIRSISVIIREDGGTFLKPLDWFTTAPQGGINDIDGTNILLTRLTAGSFDSVNYDATAYNRGWITITYEV